MIIYPPFIADTIPAFTEDKIIIPFEQNPAVSFQEITYFGLIVKNYTDSKIIASFSTSTNNCVYNYETKQGKVVFDLSYLKALQKEVIRLDETLTEEEKEKELAAIDAFPQKKQYYKFQMSYTDDEVASIKTSFHAYSTASIGRCIGISPTIELIGAENLVMKPQPYLNIAAKTFIGKYTTDISSEPLYSYRIYVKEKESGKTIQDSGMILHNTDNDIVVNSKRTSSHTFVLNYELEHNKQYLIDYEITTINGFTDKIEYIIIKEGRLPIPFEGDLYVGQDAQAIDNGYIQITLLGPPCKGEFILERTEDGKSWVTLTSFSLTKLSNLGEVDNNNKLIKKGDFTWTDWSVEQGVKYTYAISQYSGNEYSERKIATPFMAEFEHMFLSDGERQLKIAFNPKVSSFKETILEQKTDTIGSKYPYFFRNGHVRYKEFPISGLLSYYLDEAELFTTINSLGLNVTQLDREVTPSQDNFNTTLPTTGLTGYNFSAERKFKLSVLDWLNNGKNKLFRSPAEGNYVVRLMNTSLSPNDTIGRLLHTFSSTGYEVAPSDVNSLIKQNLIKMPVLQDIPPSKIIKTIQFSEISDWDYGSGQGYRVLWETKPNGEANLNKSKLNPPHVPGTIQNIQWYSAKPNLQDTIYINDHDGESDAQVIRNLTGMFSTPPSITYDSIIINKPFSGNEENPSGNEENYASTLTFEYMPDLTEVQGVDTFAKMISESTDIIFSAPAGTTLRGNNGILTAVNSEGKPIPGTYENIYKTYVMVVRKDENYQEDNECCLYFYDYNDRDNPEKYRKIDCSDGQVRYYYNIEPNIMYDKTKGLHIDIYARLGGTREALSSRLSQFVLGSSRLGIS